MALLCTVNADTSRVQLGAYMVFLGLGFGLVLPTMSLIVQNAVSPQYIGVASSSSQFFRQIGSVMGIAIFGVILAHSYRGELTGRLEPADRNTIEAANPAVILALEDPTLRLNESAWESVSAQIIALEGGEEILARASRAQDESVAVATQHIFIVALVAALLSFLFALMMKELPLRRAMGPGPAQVAGPPDEAAAGSASAGGPVQVPAAEPGPGGGGS
jgi:hypothetical protein